MDKDRLFKPMVCFLYFFQFMTGHAWPLSIADWNVFHGESISAIVREQVNRKFSVQPKVVVIQ